MPGPLRKAPSRERRLSPSTSWVAFSARAKASSDLGHVVAEDLVVAAAEALDQAPLLGQGALADAARARRTSRRARPAARRPARTAIRAARRSSVSPSGPPVSATTTRSRASQMPEISCCSRYCCRASSTRSAVHSRASSRSALRLPTPEVVGQCCVDLLGRVDVAVGQPAAQRLGGHVLELDLVGRAHDGVRHRLALGHAGDLLDDVVDRLEVLDVDGRDHVDARVEDLLDVLPALRVARARHVGVRELVDQRQLWAGARARRRRPSPRTTTSR